MPAIITTQPVNGFLDNLLGVGERVFQQYQTARSSELQGRIDLARYQAEANLAAAQARRNPTISRPMLIGGLVAGGLLVVFLATRKR
jgi:hypothetical protein